MNGTAAQKRTDESNGEAMTVARTASLLLGWVAVWVMAAGCGPNPVPAETLSAQVDGPVVRSDRAVPAVAPTPHNLVKNGSFEEADEEGRPKDWIAWPPSVVVRDPSADFEPRDGMSSVLVRSVDGEYATLNQYLDLDLAAHAPAALWVSAQGRAPIGHAMYLSLECKIAGEQRVLGKRQWPACSDSWRPVAFEAAVPTDAEPGSVRVRVVCVNREGYLFRVDDVRVFKR